MITMQEKWGISTKVKIKSFVIDGMKMLLKSSDSLDMKGKRG